MQQYHKYFISGWRAFSAQHRWTRSQRWHNFVNRGFPQKFVVGLIFICALFLSANSSPVVADVTDYAIDWIAAAPASYDHETGGGAYDDRTLRVDVANALVGNDFTCGDIVSFFAQITIDDPLTTETIEFTTVFQANSLVATGAGFVDIVNVSVNYGEITDRIAGENTIDDAIIDDGGSTALLVDERFEPADGLLGGSLYDNPQTTADLIGVIRLDDLEATDTAVVVRVDVKLDCVEESSPAGLLTAELRNATITVPLTGSLPIGIQSVIVSSVDKIAFRPDLADLTATQSVPPLVAPGLPLTYTVVFANEGPEPAVNAQLTNTLAPSLTYRSLITPAGWQCSTPSPGATGTIGCHQDLFGVRDVVTMTITAESAPTLPLGTVLSNTVMITSTTQDPQPNNHSTVTTTVSAPRLAGHKVAALVTDADMSGFLSSGDTIVYTMTVVNYGNEPATNVVLWDTIDSASVLISGTIDTTAGTIIQPDNPFGETVIIELGTVMPEAEPIHISFQVEISTSFPLTATTAVLSNQATIFSDNAATTLTDDPTTTEDNDPTRLIVTRLGAYFPCMTIPDSECAALQELYVQTNGAFWRNHEGWFATTDPCSWYGITCATTVDKGPHIVAIDLAGNGLQGVLPSNLQQLPWLERLNLANNALAAVIPAAIGELSHLEYLNIAENLLVGELPPALGSLTSLRELYLYGNNFSGDLPSTLQNLQMLDAIFFQRTQLCLPQDPALQVWLDRVATVGGTNVNNCRRIDESEKPLVLVYAGLDNNLHTEWGTLVNNLELGTDPDAFTVRLLIDGYGEKNSFEYLLEYDDDPTCPSLANGYLECNRYRRDVTLKEQTEDTAQRDLLTMFVANALYEQPNATQVILVLVGHGSGWGANALPAQPRGWTEQNGPVFDIAGGMLWDDTAGDGTLTSRSLSTRALGDALQQVKKLTGKGIDLLYLDACSMAMAEVAYEVHDSVDYLLASENTKWATFPYDRLLPYVAEGLDAQTLGERWLATEVAVLSRVPNIDYTFSLLSLNGMTNVLTSTNALVNALQPLLPEQLVAIHEALGATAFFDSNYDGIVDQSDTYLDLYDLAGQLATTFADNPAVVTAAATLQQAIGTTVLSEYSQAISETLRTPSQWESLGGLSIYWPISADEEKRLMLYSSLNLRWAADSTWDEWLTLYWQSREEHLTTQLEECTQTPNCPGLTGWGFIDMPPEQLIFLPMIQR